MSAKKLGRFTAGLFVALGLVLGASLPTGPGDTGTTTVAARSTTAGAEAALIDFEWG